MIVLIRFNHFIDNDTSLVLVVILLAQWYECHHHQHHNHYRYHHHHHYRHCAAKVLTPGSQRLASSSAKFDFQRPMGPNTYLLALAHLHVWCLLWAIIIITIIFTTIITSVAVTYFTSTTITVTTTTTITMQMSIITTMAMITIIFQSATTFLTLNNATAVNDEHERVALESDIMLWFHNTLATCQHTYNIVAVLYDSSMPSCGIAISGFESVFQKNWDTLGTTLEEWLLKPSASSLEKRWGICQSCSARHV